jgi:ABC-type phosphate transport system substrate-binding protein
MQKTSLTVVALAVLVLLPAGTTLAHGGEWMPQTSAAVAIVVHKSNPVDNLSLAELRRIFLLETQTWPHGRKITVILREPGQPERAQAIRLICSMSPREYDRHVLFKTFRGDIIVGPRSIRTASAMLRFVFNAPGAIGYVAAGELDDSVKVLRIDGKSIDDPDYPLRPPAREHTPLFD